MPMLVVCGFEVHPVSARVARGRTARVARRVGVFMVVGCRRGRGLGRNGLEASGFAAAGGLVFDRETVTNRVGWVVKVALRDAACSLMGWRQPIAAAVVWSFLIRF